MSDEDPDELSDGEIQQAQLIVNSASPGLYTLKKLYGKEWVNIESPTQFGSRFKQSAAKGQIGGVSFDHTGTDNAARYRVG